MDPSRILQIVCADPELARRYLREIERGGALCEFLVALSPTEAQRNIGQACPVVTLLDESAVAPDDSLESSAALLCEVSPVVVVASRERQAELDAFITSGWLDFVQRTGEFVPVAAGLLECRMRRAETSREAAESFDRDPPEDFGELLRHEVNNPLTGILGKLAKARIGLTALDAVTAGAGRFGAIFWVRKKDVGRAARLIGAR